MYRDALEQQPDMPEALLNLGRILEASGQAERGARSAGARRSRRSRRWRRDTSVRRSTNYGFTIRCRSSEGERRRSLTQHHVRLPAVMGLVIEEVGGGHRRLLDIFLALIVDVRKGAPQEVVRRSPAKNASMAASCSARARRSAEKSSKRTVFNGGVCRPPPAKRAIQMRSPNRM